MANELIIDLNKGENKFKTYGPWVVGLIAFAILVTFAGYFLGRWDGQQNIFGLDQNENRSTTREGWLVLENDNYSLEYPESWNEEQTDKSTKISKETGQIEIWTLDSKQPIPTKKQKQNTKSVKETELELDGRKGRVSETVYKSGEFFIYVLIGSSGEKAKLTFWIAANDEDTKKEALEIIKTFKSK